MKQNTEGLLRSLTLPVTILDRKEESNEKSILDGCHPVEPGIIILQFAEHPGRQKRTASTPTPVLDTPTSSISTLTPVVTETLLSFELPTVTLTSTPSVFLASAKDQPVNCRFGPEISYAIVGFLVLGRQAEIIGRNEDSSWWYVAESQRPFHILLALRRVH